MLSDLNLKKLIDEELGGIVVHPLWRNDHTKEVIGSLWRKFVRESKEELPRRKAREVQLRGHPTRRRS
ncbi:MAG TPA: hypothetical protein VGK27_06805 [Candidatus Deferrimicrobiaceae bacterium]|jgi:hypothetical protein